MLEYVVDVLLVGSSSKHDRLTQTGTALPSVKFDRVVTSTLRHAVLEPIRNAILFGQYPAGQRLLEAEIAEQMGVSRVPVREALHQLQHEGLVVTYPHRGTVVAAINDDEVDVLYHLRAELEGFALHRLMTQGRPELAPSLQITVDAMRRGASAGDLAELAEKDVDFHRLIVMNSGYHTLERVWHSMDGPIRAWLYRSFVGPYWQELIHYTAESHQPVVDAVATGDPDTGVAALKRHILETRSLLEKGVGVDARG
jgi:DNA-binding GntR family transcriptional regulator